MAFAEAHLQHHSLLNTDSDARDKVEGIGNTVCSKQSKHVSQPTLLQLPTTYASTVVLPQ